MSDNQTLDDFLEPKTPEQRALGKALAEIKEEVGKLKTKLRNEVRSLKRKRNDSLIPSEQGALDGQIVAKQEEFDDVDCLFVTEATKAGLARQDHYKRLVKWDEIMRKHGVAGY